LDEKCLKNIDEALANVVDKKIPPPFGGKPGEPVPEVDPDDLRTVWEMNRELQARSPGGGAIDIDIFEQACKPGANVHATLYRSNLFWIVSMIAPAQWAMVTKDGQPTNAAFCAAAKVPMEWMGVGIVRKGPPFDVEQFVRLCAESSDKPSQTT